MQPTRDLANTVQWWPCATPLAACIMQAVLVSAAIAVVFQSLVNIVWATSAIVLHLAVFVTALPVVWWFQRQWQERFPPTSRLTNVRFAPDGVEGFVDGQVNATKLDIVEVGRYWGALVLKLKPSDRSSWPDGSMGRTRRIVVWESAFGNDMFRKLSVLALWHARRVA